MANRTFYLGLMSGQSATVKVYKHTDQYTSDVSSMTALLSGASLSSTFQEITMDEDHYLYFYDGSSLISMWYPDSQTSNNTSGNKVSDYIENDGNYVFDTRYRGLHLDAGNPSGGGSTSTVAPAFTFTLTTDAASSEEAVVYGMYVRHPSGSGSNYQTEEFTATAGSNATATLPSAKAFSGQTHYLHYFKVYNGDADPGEYSYQYNSDHLGKHPTKASGSMEATGTGTVDQTQPGSPGQITLTFSSGSVSTTPAGNYSRTHDYQPGYPSGTYQTLSAIQLNTSGGGMAFNLSGSGVGNTGDFWATTAVNVDMGSPTDWRDVFTAYYTAIHAKGSTGTGDFGAVTKSDPTSITGTGTITITYSAASVRLGGSAHEVGYPSGGYSNDKKPVLRQMSGEGPLRGKVTGTINTTAVPSYSWSLVGTTLETSEDTSMARTKFNAGQIQTGSAGGIKGDSSKHLVLDFKDQLANESSVASTMLIPLQGASSGDVKRASVADIIAAGISIAGSVEGAIQLRSADGTQLAADDDFKIVSNTMTVGSSNNLDVVGTLKLGGTAVSSTAAELNILDGVTATTSELNILDGVTSTAAELNLVDGSSAGTIVNSKAVVYGSSGEVNATTLQIAGTAITSTAAELNILDGVTSTAAELNILDGVTSTAAELNLVDGSSAGTIVNSKAVVYGSSGEVNATTLQIAGTAITSTAAELNILDGVTSTAAELNILDGVTSSTSELNILDGVTATASEINVLDGASAANSSAGLAAIVGTSGDLAVARNLSVTGNLTINGTTTTVNSTTVTVDDPIFTLGGDTAPGSNDEKDRGIEFRYHDGSSAKVGFMGWDESASGFTLLSAATNTSEVFSGTAAPLVMGALTASSLTLGGVAVSSTAAELNILDGVTATASELNILDGVTSTTSELNILDGVTATASELNLVDGSSAGTVANSKAVIYGSSGEVNATTLQIAGTAITSTAAELNILDGVTATTSELNILDGVTSTAAELNLVDGSSAGTIVNSKAVVYGSSGEVNATTLQIAGTSITATAAELNILDGVTSTAAELNILDGVTSTAAELNLVDGSSAGTIVNSKAVVYGSSGEVNATTLQIAGTSITATAAELNIMDGVTATAAELNILDGVTATAAELNILDGVTSTAAELNILDGATVTVSELNIMDGDTSASATTLVDADRLVCNDAGTMKQVAMTDISDYIAGRHIQVHYMRSASGHARGVEGSVAGGSRTFLAGSNSALSATPAANTFLLLDGTSDEPHPQSTEQLEVYLNGQLLVGYHQGSASAYDYAYSADIDGSGNPGIALKPEGQTLGHADAAIDSDDVIVLKYIKA